MKEFRIDIKGKPTLLNCVVPKNDEEYLDNIVKNHQYNDVSTNSISVTNTCNQEFFLSAKILFVQQDNYSSTFKAYINGTTIPANTTINIPVYYNGMYKGLDLSPIYTFTLNGANIVYKLNVSMPNTLGVINDFTIDLGPGEDYIFKVTDFTNNFIDPDGEVISKVILYDNVDGVKFDNGIYVANTPINLSDIGNGKLTWTAPMQSAYSSRVIAYKVIDNNNNIII